MFWNLERLSTACAKQKGKQEELRRQVVSARKEIRKCKQQIENSEEALAILQTVAKSTQQELEYHIGEVVSIALGHLFSDPYKFVIEFVLKRDRVEAEIWFEKNGERLHPLSATGGGVVDVSSFALRVALWSLAPRKTRAVLILDEPFKFLSSDLQAKAGEMLKEVSRKLNLQIIMVSHIPDLVEGADKVFHVRQEKGKSDVDSGRVGRAF